MYFRIPDHCVASVCVAHRLLLHLLAILLQRLEIAPHSKHAERIPRNFVSHHSPYLMSGPFEVWRTAMPNVGVHIECFHTFFRDEMMQARGHIGKDG